MNIKNDISQVRINHLLKNISNKIFTIKLISNEHQNKCESLAVQVYTYQNICFTSILSVVSNRKKKTEFAWQSKDSNKGQRNMKIILYN